MDINPDCVQMMDDQERSCFYGSTSQIYLGDLESRY